MKFYQYLNERETVLTDFDKVYEAIKTECKTWIRHAEGAFAYRGIENYNADIMKKFVRKNRETLGMDQRKSNKLDKEFHDQFGWKPRSQGMFCTGDYLVAHQYGRVWIVYPIGAVDYLWSKEIGDLYVDIDPKSGVAADWSNEKIVGTYIENKGLHEALTQYRKNEIMVNCDAYYALCYRELGDKKLKMLKDLK